MSEEIFDVIVIGAGPAGEVLAGRVAEAGLSVAIVESELVGGECSYWGCMPSKALLRPAQVIDEAQRVPGAAEAVTGEADVAAIFTRRDQVIADLDDAGQVPWLESRGVTLVRGHGRLEGERRVRVGDRRLLAHRAVVIATGSAAAVPPIPGLREALPWTNREITVTSEVPDRLVVLGGGAIGVEMADAFTRFGASVTLVEAAPRILPREEAFASAELAAALRERGVVIREGVAATRVDRDGDGVHVELADASTVHGDELLVAVGRRPLSADIGLETVGLTPGRPIEVDDRLAAPGLPWLHAIGDVNGRALFTHSGKHQAAVLSDLLSGRSDTPLPDDGPPARVIFTEPQVAAVGYTLDDALAAGFVGARAYDVASAATAGASFVGRNVAGTSRLVIDETDGRVIGATFVGAEVAEWLHAATIAIIGRVPVTRLRDAVAPFPTRSEVWLKLLERREADLHRSAAPRQPFPFPPSMPALTPERGRSDE